MLTRADKWQEDGWKILTIDEKGGLWQMLKIIDNGRGGLHMPIKHPSQPFHRLVATMNLFMM